MSSADGTAPADTEAYNVESVIVIGMSCAAASASSASFTTRLSTRVWRSFIVRPRSTIVPVSTSKPGSGSSSPSGPSPPRSRASKGVACTRSAANVSHGWSLVEQRVTDCIQKVLSATHARHVLMHSATRGPPPSPSNVCSRLLSSPWVLEHQVRLPPSSRSQARP